MQYVILNPVRARLVPRPEDWPYSSYHPYLRPGEDPIIDHRAITSRVASWLALISERTQPAESPILRLHTRSGLPLGSDDFIARVETASGRDLQAARQCVARLE